MGQTVVVSFDFLSLVSEDSSVSYFTGKVNPKGLLGGYKFIQLGAQIGRAHV